MINAMRAYLQTEGKLDYRDCQIAYYTYSMFETPNKYKVNVNVHIQAKAPTKKTLNIDDSFDNESEAINYGIAQGKKFIDVNYENGKIVHMTPEEKNKKTTTNTKAESSSTTTPASKQQDAKKKER